MQHYFSVENNATSSIFYRPLWYAYRLSCNLFSIQSVFNLFFIPTIELKKQEKNDHFIEWTLESSIKEALFLPKDLSIISCIYFTFQYHWQIY